MKRIALTLAALLLATTTAFAQTSSFVEGAWATGGENGRNGGSKQNGLEVAGAWGISDNWYIGGALGRFDRKDVAENNYLNLNGGYAVKAAENTTLNFEGGLWFGEETDDLTNIKTKPSAIEAKVGLTQSLSDKLSVFGTLSLVRADLDTDNKDDDLSNSIWTIGGAYNFTDLFSLNIKYGDGSNGVNGMTQVVRIGARFSF